MSVTIRLSRTGKKHQPSYKIVACNTRDKRDGMYLDLLGHYNPSGKKADYVFDEKKYKEWVAKGAITSDSVKKLIEGKYEYVPYKPVNPKDAKKQTEEKVAVEQPAVQ